MVFYPDGYPTAYGSIYDFPNQISENWCYFVLGFKIIEKGAESFACPPDNSVQLGQTIEPDCETRIKLKQTIPTVDLNRYRLGDDSDRAKVVQDLGFAFEEFGFLAVENHGLDRSVIVQAYTAMKDFFALSDAAKKQYELREIGRQRGYTPFGKEKAKNRKTADVKEFWHSGPEFTVTDPLQPSPPKRVAKRIAELQAIHFEALR